MLDPSWTRWRDEIHFSRLLRENFTDDELDEPDRRIDFVCIGTGDTVHIVELKRPSYHVKSKDLDQLLDYVVAATMRLRKKSIDILTWWNRISEIQRKTRKWTF